MLMDEGDQQRWDQLPGGQNDDSPPRHSVKEDTLDFIGPIRISGTVYSYASCVGQIQVQHESEKGLSFQIWPSSLTMVKYAEIVHVSSPGFWKGKMVLELGSGCGLVGLVLAALGAQVALTDLPKTMGLLNRNIALNATMLELNGGSAVAFPLIWGETDCSRLEQAWRAPDLVVAADVIYDRDLISPLLETVKSLVHQPGGEFLLSHVRRWKHDKIFFAASKKTFEVQDTTAQLEIPSPSSKEHAQASHTRGALRLYKLVRKS